MPPSHAPRIHNLFVPPSTVVPHPRVSEVGVPAADPTKSRSAGGGWTPPGPRAPRRPPQPRGDSPPPQRNIARVTSHTTPPPRSFPLKQNGVWYKERVFFSNPLGGYPTRRVDRGGDSILVLRKASREELYLAFQKKYWHPGCCPSMTFFCEFFLPRIPSPNYPFPNTVS